MALSRQIDEIETEIHPYILIWVVDEIFFLQVKYEAALKHIVMHGMHDCLYTSFTHTHMNHMD